MLIQCEQCTGFFGAVLSSPDGLILASYGDLSGDEAAACASGLIVDSSKSLSYIDDTEFAQAMLLWSNQKIYSIRKLKDESILLIASTDLQASNILSVTQHVASRLDQALNMLGS